MMEIQYRRAPITAAFRAPRLERDPEPEVVVAVAAKDLGPIGWLRAPACGTTVVVVVVAVVAFAGIISSSKRLATRHRGAGKLRARRRVSISLRAPRGTKAQRVGRDGETAGGARTSSMVSDGLKGRAPKRCRRFRARARGKRLVARANASSPAPKPARSSSASSSRRSAPAGLAARAAAARASAVARAHHRHHHRRRRRSGSFASPSPSPYSSPSPAASPSPCARDAA